MSQDKTTQFSQQLAHIGNGSIDATLTDELAELVKAIVETCKAGTLTLTLKVKPILSGNEVCMVDMLPTYKVDTPRPSLISTRMFPTLDGDLLRRDPAQPELDFQTVKKPTRVDTDA